MTYLSILAAALVAMTSTTAAQAETWRMYTYVPNGNLPAGSGAARIAERITKESNGALTVQFNWGGSLPIKATDITQAVGDDVVQIASDGFYAGHVPLASVLRMPMLLGSPADYEKAWPVVRNGVESAFAKVGVTLLGHYLYESVTFFTNKPVTKASDLAGLKVRQADPISTDIVRAYNATPITMGTPDVATALQQGVVQGTVTTSAGGGRVWADLLTHNYRLPMYVPEGFLIVNRKRMDALPAPVQNVVRRVITEETARISAENAREEVETMAQHKAKGMVITAASETEMADARRRMETIWTRWAGTQGTEAQQMLANVRKTLGR